MKRLITLFTGLLFIALPVVLSGCDDSDEQVNRPDERFVSGVVIPTALDVCEGLEMTIEGQGFRQGDAVTLRGDSDMPAQTTGITPSSISFVLPTGIEDQAAYKFLLVRGGELQALGASRLTLKLAVNVDLGGTIIGSWNEEASIRGNGFTASDELILTQGGGEFAASVTQADNQSLRFRIPQTAVDGDCEFTLRRGDKEQTLGTAKLSLSLNNTIPDQAGASIKGMVHYGGKGIENVLVSDGDRITATDANGYYWLASDKRNGLAFVIQPSGYEVPTDKAIPQFWHPCTESASTVERIDFQLQPVSNDDFTLLVATDMHLANRNTPKDYTQFADGFVKELTDTYNASASKVYCLNLGDFAWDQYWYVNKWAIPECKKAIESFNFPFWSVMGNHDNDPYGTSDFAAETPYREELGPVYYSMNIGKVHFLMLDNTVYLNNGGGPGVIGDRTYNKYFTQQQLDWIREDLKYVDKSTPIVVGFHCPIYTYGWNGTSLTTNISMDSSAAVSALLGCFDGYTSVNVVTGHTHVNRNMQSPAFANVYEHNVAAVCGTWWWTQQFGKNNVCTDGSPAGYKVFTVSGTDLKWQFKATGLPAERQFMTYDMNSVKEYWATNTVVQKAIELGKDFAGRGNDYSGVGENEVFINAWSHEPGKWDISVTEDGKPLEVRQVWRRDPLHTISYDAPRCVANGGEMTFPSGYTPHMFAVTASSATSTLEIRVTDRFGNTYTETMKRPKTFSTDLNE